MNASAPLISVVILNYNTAELLERFLPSILKSTYSNFEVVVVDNASSDNSVDLVREKFPKVRVIVHSKNWGFAEGYNKALNELDSPYWVLLNSDVEVDANWLQPMIAKMESDENIAAVGPKILDYFNKSKFEYAGASGGFIDKWGYTFCRGRLFEHLEEDHAQHDDSIEVFWASGAALMVRANLYKAAGGLDADLFAHMEEIDLCWRFKNEGYQIWVCPDAKIYHMGGATLSKQNRRKTFLNFRNNLALIAKNAPREILFKLLLTRLLMDSLAAFRDLFSPRFSHFFSIIHAHWNFFYHLRSWLNKRSKTKNQQFSEHAGYYDKSTVFQHFLGGVKTTGELKK